MSPSKTRPQFIPARPRSEVLAAVGVGATIVLGTALLIWLIRPGTAGIPGGGGLFNRQSRMTILVLLTVAALAIVVSFFARRRHPGRFGTRASIATGSVAVLVLAIVGGIFWPGGVMRHYISQQKIPTTPVTSPDVTAPTTAPKTATTTKTGTTKPAASTTSAPGTPTTGGSATTAATTVPSPTTVTPPTRPAG